MFKEIRIKERALDNKYGKEILSKGDYGYLSVGFQENGYAYGVPVNYVYNETENSIYIHCAKDGAKVDVLKKNNKVTLTVVGEQIVVAEKFDTNYESVIVFGDAELLTERADKIEPLKLLNKKYSPNYFDTGLKYIDQFINSVLIIKISVRHLSTKKN